MFILIFLPVYLSIFFVVVFKILVSSVSDMGDSLPSLAFDVSNPTIGVSWSDGKIYFKQGKVPVPLPVKVSPGKINVILMTY